MSNDTIVAVATAPGVGGIAVVRLSGNEALEIALRHLSIGHLEARRATYCRFDNLDDVVATWFPIGYSGESTIEIACHGSSFIQKTLVKTLIESGARMATPGEFTLRAFTNGRMNLSQSEAVADLIEAVTPQQHWLAVSQLRGGYADKLKELRQQLVDLTSLLELELDFSQEDIEFADRENLRTTVDALKHEVRHLTDSFKEGNAIKRGIPVAIIGEPNVGKSTLLNALLGDDRAIVSDIPGTTRDTIEETLTIGGVTFRLIDTAGLRTTDDELERIGIERSWKAKEQASIIVNVVDALKQVDHLTNTIHNDTKRHIVALNKSDLLEEEHKTSIVRRGDTVFVGVSALDGYGIDVLKQALFDAAEDELPKSDIVLSNARHYEALCKVAQSLDRISSAMVDGLPSDLVAVDLRDALYHLGTITGDVTSDDILSNIFGRFCIGK